MQLKQGDVILLNYSSIAEYVDKDGGPYAATVLQSYYNLTSVDTVPKVLVVLHKTIMQNEQHRKLVKKHYLAPFAPLAVVCAKDIHIVGSDYSRLPPAIKVIATEDIYCEEGVIRKGSVGTPLFPYPSTNKILVSWGHLEGGIQTWLFTYEQHQHCFHVPRKNLRWGFFNPDDFLCRTLWQQELLNEEEDTEKIKVGELFTYTGQAIKVSAVLGAGKVIFTLTNKVVMEAQELTNDGSCLVGAVVEGVNLDLIGAKVRVRQNNAELFTGKFFRTGDIVRIGSDLTFKRHTLKKQLGKIITPCDEDGDIGVEFYNSVSAGSLDGLGKQGHCLYIPKHSADRVSE